MNKKNIFLLVCFCAIVNVVLGAPFEYILRVKSQSVHTLRVPTSDVEKLFDMAYSKKNRDRLYFVDATSPILLGSLNGNSDYNMDTIWSFPYAVVTDSDYTYTSTPLTNYDLYQSIPYFQQKNIQSFMDIFDTAYYKRAKGVLFNHKLCLMKLYDVKRSKLLYVFLPNNDAYIVPFFLMMDDIVYEMSEQLFQLIAKNLEYRIRENLDIRYNFINNTFYHGPEGIFYDPDFID